MATFTVKSPVAKKMPLGEKIRLRVVDHEHKEGKNAPYLNWTLMVDMVGTKLHDTKVFHITSFAENATFGIVNLLKAVQAPFAWVDAEGNEVEEGTPDAQISFDTDDIINKTFWATFKESKRKDSDEMQQGIAKMFPDNGDDE